METGQVLTVAFRWLLSRLPTLYDLRSSYLIVTSLIYSSSRVRLFLLTSFTLVDVAKFVCAKNTSDFHLKITMVRIN